MRNQKTRLMLVDDHALLLEGLARQFRDRKGYEVVGLAKNGQEALEQVARLKPDVMTLDVGLPDISGISLIPKLRQRAPGVHILVLTMYEHEQYAIAALEAGAQGFVPKGVPFETLEFAVRELMAGRIYVLPAIKKKLNGRLNSVKAHPMGLLSKREFAVLSALSRGLSLKQVAKELEISDKTVSTYRARMMKKLGLKNGPDLIRFAIGNGVLK